MLNLFPLRGLKHQEVVLIAGTFLPNGSSAPTYGTTGKRGWTVAFTSTGLFTITLDTVYAGLLAKGLSLQLATGDNKVVQFGTIDIAARTIQVRVWDVSGAAVANISANANNSISFELLLTSETIGNGT